jgi:hypothetical protein
MGISSKLVTEAGALADRGADAVAAGVAAADHDHVLAGGDDLVGTVSPATSLFCCGRNSIAKVHAVELAPPAPAGRAASRAAGEGRRRRIGRASSSPPQALAATCTPV